MNRTTVREVLRRAMPPILAVGAVALLKLSVAATDPAPFVLYFGAVALSALLGGRLSGLFATALAVLAVVLTATWTGTADLALRATLFAMEGAVVSLLIDGLQRRGRELAAAKRTVEAAQALMEGIIETAPSAVVATEPDGTLFLFNRGAEKLTGYSRSEVVGKSLLDLFVPEEWQNEVADRFRSPDPAVLRQPHRNPWRTRSGEERLIEWRCAVLPSERGNRIVGVGVDVTDLHKMEREREALAALEREALVQAEAATRAKDRFLATITHELRGPLTAILGWTQLLARSAEHSGEMAAGLRVIEENAHAQARLVDDLLDYARMATGKATLDRRPLRVDDVVWSAIEVFIPVAEEKKVEIRPVFETDDALVNGDEGRLRQVFVNVLQNALRHTDSGYIDVRAERVDGHVRILIRDTGRGIDSEFLPYVFDKFTQEPDGRSSHGSLGLGLAIVKELVTMHGGRIEATSDGPGCGATFAIDLPVAS